MGGILFFSTRLRRQWSALEMTNKTLREAEEELKEKTSYMESILRSSPDMAIAATNLDFHIIYYNTVAERLFGYSAEAVIGKTVMEMHTKWKVGPSRFERAVEIVKKEGKYTYTAMQNQNGRMRFIDSQVTGIYDDNRNLTGFLLMSRDVTEKRFEQEQAEVRANVSHILQEDRLLHDKLNEALKHILNMKGLNIQNKGGVFIRESGADHLKMYILQGEFTNQFIQKEESVPLGECLCGRAALSDQLLISDDYSNDPCHEHKFEGMINHGHYIVPLAFSGVTLGVLFLYTDPYPSRDPSLLELLSLFGKLIGMAISNDRAQKQLRISKEELVKRLEEISELRNIDEERLRALNLANEQLKIAMKEITSASQAKSEFLANISHEIRTPLNGIIGITELILDTQLTKEQWEYAEMVRSSADSLLSIINDILDFSKIEAGKLELEHINFRLRDSIGNTLKALTFRAHEKNLKFICHGIHDVPDSLIGDPTRLSQIVINLISNAIKYTEEGEIVVNVNVESEKEEEVSLHFSVSDTGIGIPEGKKEHIFEAFTQADSSTTRKYGGTGLGLAICSQLVEMMKGKIWLESKVGKGSTFHFTASFELQMGLKKEDALEEPVEIENLPVLVVDDNAKNRRIFHDMLTNWHMKPKVVDSAKEALEILKSGQEFALVLLDANMPKMDGFTLAEHIKEKWNLPIMMLISSGLRGDSARCKELGISAYLTKPAKQSELLEAIQTIIRKTSRHEKPDLITRHSLKETKNRLNILLAEDNNVNQKLAVRMLEKRGHKVTVANDGKETIAAFEKESFDLILMDMQMPELSGFEITEAIRKKEMESGVHTPVVALTAHTMKGDKKRFIEAGMDGYISKPIKSKELYETIEKLSGLKQHTKISKDILAHTLIEKKTALTYMDGDRELFKEVVELFLNNYPSLLSEIRVAISNSNSKALEREAHSIKGSAGNLSAKRVYDAASALEEIGKSGDLSNAEEAYKVLEKEIEALRPVLEELIVDEIM